MNGQQLLVDGAATVAVVCGAVIAIAGASAVVLRLARWAYAETKRRHRLDRIADLEPHLAKVIHELSPNSGHSVFDRVTEIATEILPELTVRVVNVESYVEELKARELRGRTDASKRPFREPPTITP